MTEAGLNIFNEVVAERARQDARWGGPEHDDGHSEGDWADFIREYAWGDRGADFRERMLKIAALAVAAIESHDRLTAASAT
jgi:hypothetical protein